MKATRSVCFTLCMAILISCSWLAPMDAPALKLVDEGFKKALATYATARALNGFFSVIQGTGISATPAGMGLTFMPGQLLAPVNELIKNFADIMLVASVAFGVQKVLISIGSYWMLSTALTLTVFCWLGVYYRKLIPSAFLTKILIVLLMARFAIPLSVITTDMISNSFLQKEYSEGQKVIEITSSEWSKPNPSYVPKEEPRSLLDELKAWLPKMPELNINLNQKLDSLKNATNHMINLTVVFLCQTLILPLLFLWIFWGIMRGLLSSLR